MAAIWTADGERELFVRDDDFNAALVLVHDDFRHLGRSQGVDDEGGLVRIPRNDVDLLALQLGHHRLHARTAHTDAGSDRVDRTVVGQHRHLGARARITGGGADLDDAVVHLRHFLGEQLGHETRMGSGQHDLRAFGFAPHVIDVRTDAVAHVELFTRDRLIATHDALAAAQINDDIAVFDALDRAVDDLGDAILELFVLALALGLADLMHDDLTSHLGLDATKLERRQILDIFLADLGLGVGLFGDGRVGFQLLCLLYVTT